MAVTDFNGVTVPGFPIILLVRMASDRLNNKLIHHLPPRPAPTSQAQRPQQDG